ncbi:MAG TPA: helical backbone metal receptor, partial [Armatimonadota bacterium]|nr:helical backbone metal receptor [Armatimonadota bacterium]
MAASPAAGVALFDADGALSRAYLLSRGYCCENGCRNCPYGYSRLAVTRRSTVSEGVAVATAGPPRRIVSLCPSNTEILHALGLLPRVVGVDDWSDWPPEVAVLPRLGPDLNIDMERVEALRPDLVVASLSVPGMERNVRRLRERGLTHLVLDPHGLEDIWRDIRCLATITGTEAVAEALIARLQGRIERVRQAVARVERKRRVYWEWWPRPLFAPGGRNWRTPISELAGCVSITAGVDADTARPSPDEVAAADPELILLAWTGVAARKVRPEVVLRRSGWERITAVREGQVHVMEEGLY